MKTDHFALLVSNLDAAIQFYTERLGLKLLSSEVNEADHEAFAFLELEGGNLELLQGLDEKGWPAPFVKPVIQPPYCPHLALQTEDMDQIVQLFRAKGIPIVKGPLELPGRVKWIYLSDPDNNVIEFIQWEQKK